MSLEGHWNMQNRECWSATVGTSSITRFNSLDTPADLYPEQTFVKEHCMHAEGGIGLAVTLIAHTFILSVLESTFSNVWIGLYVYTWNCQLKSYSASIICWLWQTVSQNSKDSLFLLITNNSTSCQEANCGWLILFQDFWYLFHCQINYSAFPTERTNFSCQTKYLRSNQDVFCAFIGRGSAIVLNHRATLDPLREAELLHDPCLFPSVLLQYWV